MLLKQEATQNGPNEFSENVLSSFL